MIKTRKNYDNLDIMKFILSIMIVAIHTSLLPLRLYPWLRLAIPLFFMIGSFLLNERIKDKDADERKSIINKYIIRQMKLYLFWFIVLLPITIYIRLEWFNEGLAKGIINVITSFLFSSTFFASWFITANILGTVITYKLLYKKSNYLLFPIFLICFIICCLVSSYSMIFDNMNIVLKIYRIYKLIFTSPVFSFPVALIWILLGKLFSDSNITLKENGKYTLLKDSMLLILFLALLYIEWLLVYYYTGMYNNDCYFMLLPCCYYIFKIVVVAKCQFKYSKVMRKTSTIVYPLHGSLTVITKYLVDKFIPFSSNINSIFCFIVTLSICYIVCFIIFKLDEKIPLLKYSY